MRVLGIFWAKLWRRVEMPKVGKKHFPYSKAGKAAAKAYAKKKKVTPGKKRSPAPRRKGY